MIVIKLSYHCFRIKSHNKTSKRQKTIEISDVHKLNGVFKKIPLRTSDRFMKSI